jgi:pyruvate/2-oxoglutarate/acetoin dehydrogenase E1 component
MRRRGARRQRPIGEMQFNDFVATGFNQLVNNAAKIRYRWGGSVPMVVRMPWGGCAMRAVSLTEHRAVVLPHAGLKIVAPSTPQDARALMARRRRSRSGALLRAHRALSRSAHQADAADARPRRFRSAGGAAPRGDDLASFPTAPTSTSRCVSPSARRRWHSRQRARSATLVPLDKDAVLHVARHCNRVLIVHEDSRTGGIGEASRRSFRKRLRIARRASAHRWALDTPVPYSPPLEKYFLPSKPTSNAPRACCKLLNTNVDFEDRDRRSAGEDLPYPARE